MTTATREITLETIDLYSPEKWAQRGCPHDEFDFLRKHDPVHWHRKEEPDGPGFWAVTTYDDIVYVSKRPKLFSSSRGGTNIWDMPNEEDLSLIRMMLINMDPPQHAQFRAIVSKGMTPRMINRLDAAIPESCKKIIDGVAHKGECDFVTDISAHLPLEIICELMGVPAEDRPQIFQWSNVLMGFDDPEYQTSLDDARDAAAQVMSYATMQSMKCREEPVQENNLTSKLAHANVDGHTLTDPEIGMFFLMLAIAGNETTRNATTGGAIAFMNNPDQRRKLIDNPDLIDSAVEEIVRYTTPVAHFRRTATEDTELHGKKIKDGDKVVLWYCSGNRDEKYFPDPHKFDIERSPNDHIGFGFGEHYCLGANLARLELKRVFEEVFRRIPDFEATGDVVRLQGNFVQGIKSLPVKFTPEKQ